MLEGIIQMGQALLKSDDLISNFIESLQSTRRNKQLNILKFNFLLTEDKLEIDVNEEMDEYTAYKYSFVGSADGSNSPQWYVSSKSSNYHLTETFYNLTNIDFKQEINEKINEVFKKFYLDCGEELKPKYRYTLDLNKCGIINIPMKEFLKKIKEQVNDEKKLGKKLLEAVKEEFERYLKDVKNINSNDIGLYTILIDGFQYGFKEYKDVVVESKRIKEKKSTGVCSICGTTEDNIKYD